MNKLMNLSRRSALTAACLALAPTFALPAAGKTQVEVWKDPECGCCKEWVSLLEANGFAVKVNDSGNNAARARLGIDKKHGSCHTALVGGYAVEGHVPVREIKRLLAEKPAAVGLAVPGMPVGSPGMDGAVYGGRKDSFDVLLLAKDGSSKVYQRYEGNK
jgi:hypothetical protein